MKLQQVKICFMNLDQLRAVAAIVDEGSFEGAAYELGVSTSAISQRIRALERIVGHPVITRTNPCEPTARGEAVVRLARQLELLEAEAWQNLGQDETGRTTTSIAVTADSIGTWFVPVLQAAANWHDTKLDLHVEDQDHTAALLRNGSVIAAVTADPRPVQGCATTPLGALRYVAVARAELLTKHSRNGRLDWARMPLVRFNVKDDLPGQVLRAQRMQSSPPSHFAPSFDGYFQAVKAGLGWGILLDRQLEAPDAAELVRIPDVPDVIVPLYWQTVTIPSRHLERLTRVVLETARNELEQVAN